MDNNLEQKTLAQLTQALRKMLRKSDHAWLDELVRRVNSSYLEFIDSKFSNSKGDMRDFGWNPIGELDTCTNERMLIYFPYDKGNSLEHYDEKYRRNDLPDGAVYYRPQGGYEVFASVVYGKCFVRAGNHMITEGVSIPLDMAGATKFKLFAGTASPLVIEGIRESNRRLRQTIESQKQALELKNTELDALGYVWCSGNCGGGQHRFTEPKEITFDMLKRLIAVVMRLCARGSNSSTIKQKLTVWESSRFTRMFSRISRVGKERIDYLSSLIDSFRESTNFERRVVTVDVVTHLVNNDEVCPNISGMLAELLAKGIVGVDASGELCLLGDDLFSHCTIPINLRDMEDLHNASSQPGGLWVWSIEHRVSDYKPCGHVVSELKKLGLWKSDWDNLK